MNGLKLHVAVVLFAKLSFAVLTQHDIHQSAYENLAKLQSFSGVGKITITAIGRNRYCSGVLVDPRTVLSTEKCLRGLSAADMSPDFDRKPLGIFTLSTSASRNEKIRIIGARVIAPDDDIALLFLESPLLLSDYAQIETRVSPDMFVGRAVTIAGLGKTGHGFETIFTNPTTKLAANMVIDPVDWLRIFAPRLRATFIPSHPENIFGAPAFGDGGAPLFASFDGRYKIIGVFSELVVNSAGTIGYESESYFTYLANYQDFLTDGLAREEVISNASLGLWSNAYGWSRFSPVRTRNQRVSELYGADDQGARFYFYDVTIQNPVTLDIDARVDHTLVKKNGELFVPPKNVLASYAVNLNDGRLIVDGDIKAVDFTINRGGVLSGTGTISLVSSGNWAGRSVQSSRGMLVNDKGSITLHARPSNKTPRLLIEGTYSHRKSAVLNLGINFADTTSPHLHAQDGILLLGGKLKIYEDFGNTSLKFFEVFEAARRNKHLVKKRWTLLSSDKKIISRFKKVLIQTKHSNYYDFALEYNAQSVDLVAYKKSLNT